MRGNGVGRGSSTHLLGWCAQSLEGFTKRSGRNPGHSPGSNMAGQLSGRQYLDRDSYSAYMWRGTAFQAAAEPIHSEDFVLGYDRYA